MFSKLKMIFTAITAIRDIFSMAVNLWDKYQENRRLKRKEEIKDAVNESFNKKDQREFEKAIGSDNAGKPTKHKLDKLSKRPRKNRS